jgi:hypothetical protein
MLKVSPFGGGLGLERSDTFSLEALCIMGNELSTMQIGDEFDLGDETATFLGPRLGPLRAMTAAAQQAEWYPYDYYYNDFAGYEQVIHTPKTSGRASGRSILFGPRWVSSTHLLVLRFSGYGFQGFR